MSNERPVKRTFAYVDGYNLYHGLMDKSYQIAGDKYRPVLRKYLWLNLHSYISSFFPKYYSLERIHYFTAPVLGNPPAARRQGYFWKALESLPNVQRHLGKHIPTRIDPITGKQLYSEKQSDIKLALQAYDDAISEEIDCMVFVCADSDQVPTIERILALEKGIELRVIFPPCRGSDDLLSLLSASHLWHKTKYDRLRDHQFPETIVTELFTVRRPAEWT